jgi:antitoxin component YwqK of YwqJK toxin-antitoxin module
LERIKLKKLISLIILTLSYPAISDSDLDFELSDFCYKQPNVQNRSDVLYFPNKEVGISAESTCVFKDAYSQYSSQGNLKTGKKNGEWSQWYKNGQLRDVVVYKNGQKDGYDQSWFKNGQKNSEIIWKNNRFAGPVTIWYLNGQMRLKGEFNELSAGLISLWFESGQMGYRGYFDRSQIPSIKENLHTTWYENGNIKSQGIYQSDKKEGKWIYWYANGQKDTEGDYDSNKKVGRWDKWNEEGNKLKELPEGMHFSSFIPDENELDSELKKN